MVFGNAPKLELASLLQITSVPLETVKSLVCWDLLTGRTGLGLRPLLPGKSCSVSGPWGCAAGPEILRWLLLDAAMPPYQRARVRWSGSPGLSTCYACGGASALLGCWWRKSLTPLCCYSLEQRLCGADGDSRQVSGADRHPFPGGNEPGRRGWWGAGQRRLVFVAASAWRRASLTLSCSYEELLDVLE